MKSTTPGSVLLCCLALLAFPAHAIINCVKSVDSNVPSTVSPNMSSTTSPANEAPRIARLLAGVELPGEPGEPGDTAGPTFSQYAAAVTEGWQPYTQNFGQPLNAWAAREVRQDAGKTVFYPFSGPDLPSILSIYPAASRFVMISDQYALEYFDPFALKEPEQSRIVRELSESWARFGRLGFFLTRELNKGGGQRKLHVGPSMILMAFAARLGYEVRSIRPVCLEPSDLSIRPIETKDARWASVRMELRKNGRDIVVDYLQQDLSNRGLNKRPEARALIESLAKAPILVKAASHLPQKPAFSIIRDAILMNTPLLVQDETGLEYDDMASRFNVKLYGEYVGAHRLFKEATNLSLVKAYKDRSTEVRPLDFKLGYEKEAGSAIQVATRK
jgi:hypothetical protein